MGYLIEEMPKNVGLKVQCNSPSTGVVFIGRWGNTPLDDAMQFGHHVIATILQQYQLTYTNGKSSSFKERKTTMDTLGSINWGIERGSINMALEMK